MKRLAILIVLFCVSFTFALNMVNSTSLQLESVPNPLNGWQSPDVATAQKFGYLIPIYSAAVSNGYTRFALTPPWTNNGDGTASLSFYDLSNASIASNAAAVATSNAIAAAAAYTATAIAWTNTFTNLWMQPYHVAAAHTFKTLGAKYLPGWPTNTTWTYNTAMAAFAAMPAGSQTVTQLWDNVFWQRSYIGLSDMLPTYFPSINTNDPTDYNLKAYPELQLWDMPGIK